MSDHDVLGLGDVLEIHDDNVLEIRHSIVLEQFHFNLRMIVNE